MSFTDEHIEELKEEKYLLLRTAATIADGKKHIAFLFGPIPFVLLVYRVDGDDAILLLDTRSNDLPGLWAIGWIELMNMEEWGDLNRDGRPDLVVYYSYLGTAWQNSSQVHVWQIEQNGEMVDLTTPIYENYRLIPQGSIADWNDDGILDVRVGDYRGEWYGGGHGGVASFRIYAWDGNQVYDESNEFRDWYDERISEDQVFVENSHDTIVNLDAFSSIVRRAFRLLLDYENSGRRDEGWQAYWVLTNPENWSRLDPEAAKSIEKFREYHKSEYEAGEPFTAPPFTH